MTHRYILDGKTPRPEPDLIKWAKWFEANVGNRHVAKTSIGDLQVSTVFLAIDHQFDQGPPILFETMVFGGDDDMQTRYHTWEEAERGHEAIVAKLCSGELTVPLDGEAGE